MSWKHNVNFVLVGPKEPGNVGSSARAIKNMGFRNLVLVNPDGVPAREDRWLAVHSHDVLDQARTCLTLDEAIGDSTIIAAVSRRTGKTRGVILGPCQGAIKLIEAARAGNRVSVLFGREDRGLLNEEVERCGFVINIPTDAETPSLNLSQAVMVTAYELSRAEAQEKSPPGLVSMAELENLFKRSSGALKKMGYIPHGEMDLERTIMRNLRRLALRSGLTEWELGMLHGVISQMEKFMPPGGPEQKD